MSIDVLHHLLADAASNAGQVDFTGLIQYGVLGLVTLALIFGRIVPWPYYGEKKDEIARLHDELAKERANTDSVRTAKDAEIGVLRAAVDERIIPLSIRLLDVVEQRRRSDVSP